MKEIAKNKLKEVKGFKKCFFCFGNPYYLIPILIGIFILSAVAYIALAEIEEPQSDNVLPTAADCSRFNPSQPWNPLNIESSKSSCEKAECFWNSIPSPAADDPCCKTLQVQNNTDPDFVNFCQQFNADPSTCQSANTGNGCFPCWNWMPPSCRGMNDEFCNQFTDFDACTRTDLGSCAWDNYQNKCVGNECLTSNPGVCSRTGLDYKSMCSDRSACISLSAKPLNCELQSKNWKISPGQETTLNWTVEGDPNLAFIEYDDEGPYIEYVEPKAGANGIKVKPSKTTTYIMTITKGELSTTCHATITVAPLSCTLSVSPGISAPGGIVELSWEIQNYEPGVSVSIIEPPDIGDVTEKIGENGKGTKDVVAPSKPGQHIFKITVRDKYTSGTCQAPVMVELPEVTLYLDPAYIKITKKERKFRPTEPFNPFDDVICELRIPKNSQILILGQNLEFTLFSKNAKVFNYLYQPYPEPESDGNYFLYKAHIEGWPGGWGDDDLTMRRLVKNKEVSCEVRINKDPFESDNFSISPIVRIWGPDDGKFPVETSETISETINKPLKWLVKKAIDNYKDGFNKIEPFKKYGEKFSQYVYLSTTILPSKMNSLIINYDNSLNNNSAKSSGNTINIGKGVSIPGLMREVGISFCGLQSESLGKKFTKTKWVKNPTLKGYNLEDIPHTIGHDKNGQPIIGYEKWWVKRDKKTKIIDMIREGTVPKEIEVPDYSNGSGTSPTSINVPHLANSNLSNCQYCRYLSFLPYGTPYLGCGGLSSTNLFYRSSSKSIMSNLPGNRFNLWSGAICAAKIEGGPVNESRLQKLAESLADNSGFVYQKPMPNQSDNEKFIERNCPGECNTTNDCVTLKGGNYACYSCQDHECVALKEGKSCIIGIGNDNTPIKGECDGTGLCQ